MTSFKQDLSLENELLETFQKDILDWYKVAKRDLPWRKSPNPYQVWVSEVMLQQTQVATVTAYYLRWLEAVPTLEKLARLDDDVLYMLWAGLGYYQRARNLKRGAQYIIEHFEGIIPQTVDELLKIPSVGPYTAGAISSIAFGKNVAAVDGNVERVLSRLLGYKGNLADSGERKYILRAADSLANFGSAGLVNQAMMDLGASLCSKRANCISCFARKDCRAHSLGIASEIPRKEKKLQRYDELRACLCVQFPNGELLMLRRSRAGLLGGLWELPTILCQKSPKTSNEMRLDWQSLGNMREQWESYLAAFEINFDWKSLRRCHEPILHVFTHIDLCLIVDFVQATSTPPAPSVIPENYNSARPVSQVERQSLGISTLYSKALAAVEKHIN